MEITSRDNPLIKECIKLLHDTKARRKSGRFVAEGARLCEDAARSAIIIEAALATQTAKERYAAQWQTIRAAASRAYTVSEGVSHALSDTDSPQGIVCLCSVKETAPFDVRPDGLYAALEGLQDPGNMGTVIRTAEALGIDGLLLSRGCCDVYSPKVLRASMGGVFRVPMRMCDDLCKDLTALSATMPVLACVVDSDADPITGCAVQGAVAVIGNEGNGLTEAAVAACNRRVTIPMAGRAESLNASMAAGILMWELRRRKGEV